MFFEKGSDYRNDRITKGQISQHFVKVARAAEKKDFYFTKVPRDGNSFLPKFCDPSPERVNQARNSLSWDQDKVQFRLHGPRQSVSAHWAIQSQLWPSLTSG